MKRFIPQIVRAADRRTEAMIKLQYTDPQHPDFGGVPVERKYTEPKATFFIASQALAAYFTEGSRYFGNEDILRRVSLAADYCRKNQREDGTFDLLSCNFYAAPDTAFIIHRVVDAWRILDQYGKNELAAEIREKLTVILRDAADGMSIGGFHTPNHRWAITSALLSCANILGIEKYRLEAEKYLVEGIDFTDDGEYAERSAAIYNVVNNHALTTVFEETGDKTFLGYVEKNLEMMLAYFEPDGSVFTNNSTRQDRGQRTFPENYIYPYLFMAHKTGRKDFSAAAHRMLCDLEEHAILMPDMLDKLLLNPALFSMDLEAPELPDRFTRWYKESGVLRVRHDDISWSVVSGNQRFLYFQKGAMCVDMRIGASYFEHRFFAVQDWTQAGDTHHLHFRAKGWYYTPFETYPGTSDWWKMDNASRKKLYKKDLEIDVFLRDLPEGIEVTVRAGGVDRVPLRVELSVPGGSWVEHDSFMLEGPAGGAMVLREGMTTVTKDGDKLRIGPGFGNHRNIDGKFGSAARSGDAFTLYMTDFTDFEHRFTIEKVY